MFTHPTRARGAGAIALLGLSVACTEPVRTRAAANASTASLRLVVAPSHGGGDDTVRVSLMAFGFGAKPVGSYTVRLQYDTAALRFAGESATKSAATRASNAQSGVLRAAGIAPQGFADGQLALFAFVPLGSKTSLPAITLDVQELHRADRTDAVTGLAIIRNAAAGGTP